MDRVRVNSLVRVLSGMLLALVAAGCVTEFEHRYAVAEELRQQAAARGYEWIGTSALLEQARQEAAAGNTDAALELVEAARFQADAALQQAEHEAEAWRKRIVN
jgi:hypothetical protein